MNLKGLTALFADAGCKKLYVKILSENDNSKNQVYFAGTVETLNVFPSRQVFAKNTKKGPSFKSLLNFFWLSETGQLAEAPRAQLILYSQYPEVRFSGFLQGCKNAPSELMNCRIAGRILFLGITNDGRILGFVTPAKSPITTEFRALNLNWTIGVFSELQLPKVLNEFASRGRLLSELHRINQLGWINSKQLGADGHLKPCNAPQCGGFTLEAELGVSKNSLSEPDYLGWEVKQHSVSNFDRIQSGAITLMTPEPTGGFYKEKGAEAFVRKYGYPDKAGRPDRLNFGGVHKVGKRHETTGLTMCLQGYSIETEKITDANGCIALLSDIGDVAASWAFAGLFEHWSRKHTKAVYVPSQCRKEPTRQYQYGYNVRLAETTDSLRLLKALAEGIVYYDPGIKLENASGRSSTKRRSQFRVSSKEIGNLYREIESVRV